MSTRILVILGHPDRASLCGALAESYAQGAQEAGAEVEILRLGELEFDPVLHQGYQKIQPLEPDLQRAQERITWAKHLVLVYPTWWGGPPALLKGFFDRAFLPGFAFRSRAKGPFWDRLLSGRSGRLLVTADSPGFYDWLVNGMPAVRMVKQAVLAFCGVKPVAVHRFATVKTSNRRRRLQWLTEVRELGVKDAKKKADLP
ncbi:MAG: NAD(P)H-dependent oxidoreductase [Holophaga sp.]